MLYCTLKANTQNADNKNMPLTSDHLYVVFNYVCTEANRGRGKTTQTFQVSFLQLCTENKR